MRASYADFVWGLPPSTDPLYPSVGLSTPEQKSGERYKVIMVGKDTPAEAAGFKVGDEIVSIDGLAYTDKETVNRLMSEKRWGDAVVYKVVRGRRRADPHGLPAPPAAEDEGGRVRRGRAVRRSRTLAFLSAVAVLAAASASAAGARRRRRARHSMKVTLDPSRGWLSVVDTLTLPWIPRTRDRIPGATEFLLHAGLKVTASEPAVSEVPLGDAARFLGINASSATRPAQAVPREWAGGRAAR